MWDFGSALSGADPFSAMERYTFGTTELYDGFHLIPMLIGLFALPEIFNAVRAGDKQRGKVASLVGDRLSWAELKNSLRTIFRSTGIGTAVGLVPGLGQTVAAMMGYIAAKNASKHPETFGKGDLDGVAAAEAANNAVNGPTMVPLLTLGIPGDNVTALLLGAFMMQGSAARSNAVRDQRLDRVRDSDRDAVRQPHILGHRSLHDPAVQPRRDDQKVDC